MQYIYKVKGGELKGAVQGVRKYELANKYELYCNHKYISLCRWASYYTGAKCKEGSVYTKCKLHTLSYTFIMSEGTQYNLLFK